MTHHTFTGTFGELLKYLRRRARLTQRELAIAVGYTEAHICRLEKNERLPDVTTVAALFIPALTIEDEPPLIDRLLRLAAQARGEGPGARLAPSPAPAGLQAEPDLGVIEAIPAPPRLHVRRAALLQRIRAALEDDRCVALCGMPGMGKTVLAAAVAHSYQSGPVFWLTLAAGVNTSADAIVRQLGLFCLLHGHEQVRPLIQRHADTAPIPLDLQLLLIRAALERQPALLCFDNCHLLDHDEAGLAVLRYLSGTTSAALLLTSRQSGLLPITHINVGGFEPGEGHDLIAGAGLALTPSVLARLLARTDGSPMLLRLAINPLRDPRADAAAFVERLETHPQVTAYVLSTILGDISPATQCLVALLSIFRQPVDLYDAALGELLEQSSPPCQLRSALVELERRHLIEDARRAALHPLVRDHLSTLLSTDTAQRKRLHHLAATWLEDGRGDVVEAAYHWTQAGDLEQAAELIGGHSEQLFYSGQAQAACQVIEEALTRAQRRRGATAGLRRRLLSAHGDLLRGTFRAAESEHSYRQALALAQGMPVVRAQLVRSLAQLLLQRGQAAEALRLCQSALAELGPADTVLRARLNAILCRAYLVQSHYAEAEREATAAIGLAEQFAEALPQIADDVRARAERTLGWISYTRRPEGAESLEHYRRGLACARRAGLRVLENALLMNIGTSLTERGELDDALRSYQEALAGFEAMGDMYGKAGVLHNLGFLYHQRGELEATLACSEEAGAIARRIGDEDGVLSAEGNRASMLISFGRLSEARMVLDQALAEVKATSDTWALGTCYCLLAEVLLLQGEVAGARATAQRALAMPGVEHNARIRTWATSGLALVQLAAGALEAAGQTIAPPPPEDVGLELAMRWRLVQCIIASARGHQADAQLAADAVIELGRQKGGEHALPIARQLIEHPGLPATEMLRLLLVTNASADSSP